MNIGIVTAWFSSGAGYVSQSYEKALQSGHKVYIYARGGLMAKDNPMWNRSNVTWAPSPSCLTGIHSRHFRGWLKLHSIDTIIFNEQRQWKAVIDARKQGIIVGAYVDYYTQETVNLFYLYDFLICNTKRHYSVFKDHPQCWYFPWGTQVDVFTNMKIRPERPLTLLISAGWDGLYAKSIPWLDRRGTGLAIRIFRKIEEDCRLIIFSQVPLKQCPNDWQIAVQADPRIEFQVGTFDPVPYTLGDIYLYPSRLDGIGLTLPEALSCGLPAITTNSAPMNEFVLDNENGKLVDVKEFRGRPDGYYWPEAICDEDSLREAILFYIRNPEMVYIHSNKARAHALKYLSWDKNSAFLVDWIQKQKKIADSPGLDIDGLIEAAIRYDQTHSPTPFQKIATGGKAMVSRAIRSIIRN